MDKSAQTPMTGDDVPEWDTAIGAIWIIDILTAEKRKSLIESPNHIWPRNISNDDKNTFLDTANTALNFWKLRKENAQNRAPPKEQREQLNDVVSTIQKLKKQLTKLTAESLTHADMSYMNAKFLTKPPFELWFKSEYGHHVSSLFSRTWMQLDDTERVLISAANRIHVDVSYRPENHVNDCIVTELAREWRLKNGEYPPRSKTGWFAKFIVELGTAIDLTLSLELAKRCIDFMETVDKKYIEENEKSQKSG
ncbi:hypothetical protein ACO0LC_25870 [Undibacterium sp. JH2W]|uniref:hypothetical protein n=1 Tax=Undibacterium sp. JH2W TaxID=3413037 RepID=UPI003BF3E945